MSIESLACWVKFQQLQLEIFFFFFTPKTEVDISCKLCSLKTVCMKCKMKCKILFSGENVTILSYAELSQEVVMVKVNRAKLITQSANSVTAGTK